MRILFAVALPLSSSTMTVFGDTLAMVLVVVGALLTGLLIWLLMRKYDRDHGIGGASCRKADTGRSPPSRENATPVSPVQGREAAAKVGPLEAAQPADELRMCPVTPLSDEEPTQGDATAHGAEPVPTSPKEPPVTSPVTVSTGEEVLSPSLPEDAFKVSPSEAAQQSEKPQAEGKQVQGSTKRGGTAGRNQMRETRESPQLTRQSKRKTKKSAAAQLNTTDSSAVKRKSKRKPTGMVPTATLPATRATSAAITGPPAQTALAESDRTSRSGANPSQGAGPHDDANDPAFRELREASAPRAPDNTQCALPLPRHQGDTNPVPTELDIISVAADSGVPMGRQQSAQHEGSESAEVSSLPSDGAAAETAATTRGGNVAPPAAAATSEAAISRGSSAEVLLPQGESDDAHEPDARRTSDRTSLPKHDSPDRAQVPAKLDTFSVEPSALDKSEATAPGTNSKVKPKQDL
ncbi:uncharacterized protein [Dermacentor andersoni]|uniref:uncharacterized protein n=1 Tax=Dermacentor andersoni TaxID=34620 RepID=UPI002417EEAC|nr:uncharacterized protein LOC126526036 [Dermacentor andersoni]